MPDEELPEKLVAVIERWQVTANDPSCDIDRRWSAARALLIIGTGHGEQRRRELWSSGLVDRSAAAKWCDRQSWWNRVVDWTHFDHELQMHADPVPELPDGEWWCFTYADTAGIIDTLPELNAM